MKLNKEQALDLIKVLSHYDTLIGTSGVDAPTLRATQGRLEKFVLGEDDCCDHAEEDDDEEDEEDEEADEDSASEEDEEESRKPKDDEGDEADDESEEADGDGDDDEEELEVDAYVLGSELHDLKVAKAKIISSSVGDPDDDVTLEFENTEDDNSSICDLLVSGEAVGPITHVRRKGSELHVAENNGGRTWHRFHVSRFPKGWADTLTLDDLHEVE